MQTFFKSPPEQYPLTFDFTGLLPTGWVLLSGTVSATDQADNSNQTSTVLNSATATIASTTQAQIYPQAGTLGHTYLLKLLVTLQLASGTSSFPPPVLEEDVLMTVGTYT